MSDVLKLTILGAGSVRCAPPVISSLATYFGERPIEVRLYDADEERLDLMDRLARHCFRLNKANHTVLFRTDPKEALEEADRIVLMVGRNCARKFQRVRYSEGRPQGDELTTKTLSSLMELAPSEADVLSLQRKSIEVPLSFYRRMDWPGEPTDESMRWLPHQILRWVRAEEPMFDFLKEQQESPFKSWLNDPNAADIVVNRSNEG